MKASGAAVGWIFRGRFAHPSSVTQPVVCLVALGSFIVSVSLRTSGPESLAAVAGNATLLSVSSHSCKATASGLILRAAH